MRPSATRRSARSEPLLSSGTRASSRKTPSSLPLVVRVADRGADGTLRRMTLAMRVEPRAHAGADRSGALFPKLQLCAAHQPPLVGGVLGDYSSATRSSISCATGAVGSASWK